MSGTQKTSQGCSLMTSQMLTYGVSERHAKTSPSQDGGGVWRETSQSLCRKSSGSCGVDVRKTGQDTSFTKTSKECCQVSEAETLAGYSAKWMSAGMMRSGRLSTLRPTYRNTEKEYTLSDILEAKVPDKYFLSTAQLEKILLSRSDDWQEKETETSTGFMTRQEYVRR